jgi:hypothetical protein
VRLRTTEVRLTGAGTVPERAALNQLNGQFLTDLGDATA